MSRIILIWTTGLLLSGSNKVEIITGVLVFGISVVIFIRFGLLVTTISMWVVTFFSNMLFPITTNFSTWYAGSSLFAMFLILAFAVFAFYTSLGGQKVFTGKMLEE